MIFRKAALETSENFVVFVSFVDYTDSISERRKRDEFTRKEPQ
jgi:hypothetical protein